MSSGELTDMIRTLAREKHESDRLHQRDTALNKSRLVKEEKFPEKTLTQSEVKKMLKNLKRPTDIRQETLASFKRAFIQDRGNMITFLKVEGALHSLVANLMNHSPTVQLLAAECACNLSLGDSKTCYQLAKASAPYLISILNGLNYNLMNYALMIIGNICAMSRKGLHIFKTQGVLHAFQSTIRIQELREATVFALIMFTKASIHSEIPEIEIIVQDLLPFLETSLNVQWLLYHLTTMDNTKAILMDNSVADRILTHLDSFEKIDQDSVQSITSLIRALGNLVSESSGAVARSIFNHWESFFDLLKRIMKSNYLHLQSEAGWLLGNLVNHPSRKVQDLASAREDDLNWFGSSFAR